MDMQEFPKRLILPGSGISSNIIPLLVMAKYIYLDQGGELFNNPDVNNLLHSFFYTLHPTGDDKFHQNLPVNEIIGH